MPQVLFFSVEVIQDTVFANLTEASSNDLQTKVLLQTLCKKCLLVMDRQLQTQLPGGAFWDPDANLQKAAASCPSTNISGERKFAMSDQEMLRARNAKIGFVEGKVMFRANKTGDWLDGKSNEEKILQTDLAWKSAKTISIQQNIDGTLHHLKMQQKLHLMALIP
jgi:hypothetical protein